MVISFEPLEQLRQFAEGGNLPFQILSDAKYEAYKAFGLQEGTMGRVFGPATIWAYVQGLFQGRWPRMPRGNTRQLGGDVVIDAGGKVALLYKSRDPSDRPAVRILLDAVRQLVQR